MVEARQAAGSQDKLWTSLQRTLAGLESSVASERHAWAIAQEEAGQRVHDLECDRERLRSELRSIQEEHCMMKAALEAVQQDKNALQNDPYDARAELRRRADETSVLDERRVVVESGVCSVVRLLV